MSKKNIWTTAIFGISAFVLYTGYLSVFKTENSEATVKNYRTIKVSKRNLSTSVIATGIVKPKVGAEVRVGSRVSGIVTKLYVNVGDSVRKGDILAQIDPTEFKAQKDRAYASLLNSKANLEYIKANYERLENLYNKEFISKDELDIAKRNKALADADILRLEADLRFASAQLNYTRIIAPISGVVGSVSTQEGETVAASFAAPTFVTLIDLDRLEVWAYVDETDIGKIQTGQKSQFTVDTYNDLKFPGSIAAIYPQAELKDNVVNYVAIVDIEDFRDKVLRPEMTTTVSIFTESILDRPSLPIACISYEDGEQIAYVLKNNKVLRRGIKTGVVNRKYAEIISGLNLGESVIMGYQPDKI